MDGESCHFIVTLHYCLHGIFGGQLQRERLTERAIHLFYLELCNQKWQMSITLHPTLCSLLQWGPFWRDGLLWWERSHQEKTNTRIVRITRLHIVSGQWAVARFYLFIWGVTTSALSIPCVPHPHWLLRDWQNPVPGLVNIYVTPPVGTSVKLLICWDPLFSLIRPVSEGFAETLPETLTLILTNVHLAYFLIFPLNI